MADVRWCVFEADGRGRAKTELGEIGTVVAPDRDSAIRRARAVYGPTHGQQITAVSNLELEAREAERWRPAKPREKPAPVRLTRGEQAAWAEAVSEWRTWLSKQKNRDSQVLFTAITNGTSTRRRSPPKPKRERKRLWKK